MDPGRHSRGSVEVNKSLLVPTRKEMKNPQHWPIPCRIVKSIYQPCLLEIGDTFLWPALVAVKHPKCRHDNRPVGIEGNSLLIAMLGQIVGMPHHVDDAQK